MTQQFSLEERIGYLKQYGSHCMAYSTLQPGMEYFDLPDVGYIAYMPKWGTRFALSEPICAEQDKPKIVEEALREHKDTCFVQIYEPTARMLYDNFGYYGTQMGVETWLDLNKWDLKGKEKAQLRHWINKARKEGVTIEEMNGNTNNEELKIIEKVWRENQANPKRFRFLLKDLYEEKIPDSRCFIAKKDSKKLAFAEFDPLYKNGEVIGYYFDINRRDPNAPHGTSDTIVLEGIDQFTKEGKTKLSLGLSALNRPIITEMESKLTNKTFNLIHRFGNSVYPFKGVEQHKKKYAGKEIPVFYSTKKGFQIGEILKFFKMANLI